VGMRQTLTSRLKPALRATSPGAGGVTGVRSARLAGIDLEFLLLPPVQRCVLIVPLDDDPLAEFAREEPELLAEAPSPVLAVRASRREGPREPAVVEARVVVPVREAGSGQRLYGWLRPFWAGCVVGGMTAAWVAIGWSDMAVPAGASVVSPQEREVGVDAVSAPGAWSEELFAAPEMLPPPALAHAAAAPVPPPLPPRAPVIAVPRRVEPTRFEGSLAVDSTPARARVFINGEPVGLTPVVMTSLPIGSRAIRVEADDHEPWWSVVQVVAQQETSIRVALPPSVPAVSDLAP